MRRIRNAEKRERWLILLAYGALVLVGLSLLFLFYNQNIFLVLLGIIVTILGLVFAFRSLSRLNNEAFPITRTILNEPRKIVWVYSVVTQRMPFGFQIFQSGIIYFKLIDGGEMSLVFPATELKSISEMLNYHLPHASFGYTKEREQWFLAHPGMLLKDEKKK